MQPWTAKINQKQTEIDVAVSERDALSKKAEEVRALRKEAVDALENLQAEYAAKVFHFLAHEHNVSKFTLDCHRIKRKRI